LKVVVFRISYFAQILIFIDLSTSCALVVCVFVILILYKILQIIDLKAELFRKQEEFKKQQLQSKNVNVIKGKTVEKASIAKSIGN
jgi:hypothetical protein